MAIIISGKELSQQKKEQMKAQVATFEEKYGRLPKLSVILVGDNPASVSYVSGKGKACVEIGIINETIRLSDTISQDELLNVIEKLNEDDTVDGILVQLPLPKHINSNSVINAIKPEKDVDGFHPSNVAALYLKQKGTLPCTPRGIIQVLDSKNLPIQGKKAVVVGRSNIVGLPVAKMLLDRNATVVIAHSKTYNLAEVCREADILIAAVGKPRMITADMVKDGAVVIDVGVNRDPETGKLCGDVDFENVKEKASYITKVPGGIGPMTISCLMENTIECYLEHVGGNK